MASTTQDKPQRTYARASKPKTPEQIAREEWIAEVWAEYKSTTSADAKAVAFERLLIEYAPLVRTIASRVGSSLPSSIDLDDLNSYGMMGLMDAIDKFEPERGFKFETYGTPRINGAIIDELRTNDWVPRSVRTKIRSIEKATVSLERELGRTPTDAEIAAEMGIEVRELRAIHTQAANTNVMALDDLMHRSDEGDNSSTLGDRLSDARVELPGEGVESAEVRSAVHRAIRELDERYRIVITLYVFENLTLAEIGQVLNVTESRVCQLRNRANLALKAKLEALAAA